MSAGKRKTIYKLNGYKLFAPSFCNEDLFAIYMSVITGSVKSFIDSHPDFDENMMKSSMVKRICCALVADDVVERVKNTIKETETK